MFAFTHFNLYSNLDLYTPKSSKEVEKHPNGLDWHLSCVLSDVVSVIVLYMIIKYLIRELNCFPPMLNIIRKKIK